MLLNSTKEQSPVSWGEGRYYRKHSKWWSRERAPLEGKAPLWTCRRAYYKWNRELSKSEATRQGILLFNVTAFMGVWFSVGIDVTIYNFSIPDLICCFINVSTNHLHMSVTISFIDHFLVLHFTLSSWWFLIFTSDVRTMLAPRVKMVFHCYCKR